MSRADAPSIVTVTVIETAAAVTETADTVDAGTEPDEALASPTSTGSPDAATEQSVPQLELEVFSHGCGVIRSEAAEGVDYQNLTWSFMDQDGFQVLGRNAGERPGTDTSPAEPSSRSSFEAYVDGAYRPVSNEVTITCQRSLSGALRTRGPDARAPRC